MTAKLTLIEGGLCAKEYAEKSFVSAFVTDTRLMGQVAMGIHWKIIDHPEAEDLYQFFSFDAEECGLDNYISVWDGDIDALDTIRQTVVGPLGGEDVIISEREARGLFTEFYKKNRRNGQEFGQGIHEYRFLIDDPTYLDDEEGERLLLKMCTEIKSDLQLVNYFMMRICAKDLKAARILALPDVAQDLFDDLPPLTLLKNTVHETDGRLISHSLVEHDGIYEILVTAVEIENRKISVFTRSGGMVVSYQEAALMLAQPEYLTVYRIIVGPEEFEDRPLEFNYNIMITEHDNGRMYMAFNPNNDHVDSRVFKLSGDVFGLYFISYSGEFIVSAQSKEAIIQMERDLLHMDIGAYLLPTGKFEFQEPVLLQFADSDFEYFEEFLEAITGDE